MTIGPIVNPETTNAISSFAVYLENGNPTFSKTTGLVINYTTNDIYDASVETENLRAGSDNKYTFKFKITNPIPQDGKISLKFPTLDMLNSFDESADVVTVDLFGTPAATFNALK